jgi:hypothetical protein
MAVVVTLADARGEQLGEDAERWFCPGTCSPNVVSEELLSAAQRNASSDKERKSQGPLGGYPANLFAPLLVMRIEPWHWAEIQIVTRPLTTHQ